MTTAIPDGEGFALSTDREQLRFGRITCPPWVTEIGRDVYGLWVVFEVKSVRQRLRWIPPGCFMMGSPPEDAERIPNEWPQHEVHAQGFWLFDTPCTQDLWQAVMGTTPSHFKGEQRPVERVSWEDCQTFLRTLNTHVPGIRWRLPTEAQWEYACRAGTETARYGADLGAIAWYVDNSNRTTHAVAQKRPNAWGLYDMLGNVDEWCHDGRRDYKEDRMIDPIGALDADANRALRGGSWLYTAQVVRAAHRYGFPPGDRNPFFGFRGASSG